MGDYPNKVPVFPIFGRKINYPRVEHKNQSYREIEAICTELGVNPRSISDAVAPGASPISVANYLDMLANIVKNLSGAATWNGGAVPIRRLCGGNGLGGQIGAGTTVYFRIGSRSTDTSVNEVFSRLIVPYRLKVTKLYVTILGAQPATGSLVFTLRRNQINTSLVLTIAAGAAAGTYANTAAAEEFFRNDTLSISIVNNAAGNSAALGGWSMEMNQVG